MEDNTSVENACDNVTDTCCRAGEGIQKILLILFPRIHVKSDSCGLGGTTNWNKVRVESGVCDFDLDSRVIVPQASAGSASCGSTEVDQTGRNNAPSIWSPNTTSSVALHWASADSASCDLNITVQAEGKLHGTILSMWSPNTASGVTLHWLVLAVLQGIVF
ncbi:hypothetical protein VNO78_25785 [Psophocarpus tetragonolobus]|uniref:Uncharacterized protein n=1 Tax=Psophocarpus tetragonolobus TaxID=3891 RepID=A0AAN9XG41_PSOTE